jgi:hypothetical protein
MMSSAVLITSLAGDSLRDRSPMRRRQGRIDVGKRNDAEDHHFYIRLRRAGIVPAGPRLGTPGRVARYRDSVRHRPRGAMRTGPTPGTAQQLHIQRADRQRLSRRKTPNLRPLLPAPLREITTPRYCQPLGWASTAPFPLRKKRHREKLLPTEQVQDVRDIGRRRKRNSGQTQSHQKLPHRILEGFQRDRLMRRNFPNPCFPLAIAVVLTQI